MNKNYVTANEILEMIEQDYHTKNRMAEELGCSISTIENRLKELRIDGHAIIHGNNGLRAVTREMIEEDSECAETMEGVIDWYLGSIKGLTRLVIPVKKYLPAMKRSLSANLSMDERRQLTRHCARTVALLTMIDAEEEIS